MQMSNFTNNCYLREEDNINMTKNAITWIREDFRIENNPALSYATQNHENVLALYTVSYTHLTLPTSQYV